MFNLLNSLSIHSSSFFFPFRVSYVEEIDVERLLDVFG